EPGASFTCLLDGSPYSPCSSPVTLTGLGDGTHTFSVQATDAAGNADPTPASVTWTVDSAAPDTSIDSHPNAVTSSTSATIAFSSEPGATFTCLLDASAYAPCTPPASLTGLG